MTGNLFVSARSLARKTSSGNNAASSSSFSSSNLAHQLHPAACEVWENHVKPDSLFEWQESAIPTLLEASRSGENAIVSAATGNGKASASLFFPLPHYFNFYLFAQSIVVTPSILECVLSGRRKFVLYIVPLRALVAQVVEHFEKVEDESSRPFGAMAYTGETAAPVPPARGGGILICTPEKATSIVLSLIQAHRLNEIALVIVDEAHNVGRESSRAEAWQLVLTLLLFFAPSAPLFLLSATIASMISELQEWLRVKEKFIVRQEARRVPLYHFCYVESTRQIFAVKENGRIERDEKRVAASRFGDLAWLDFIFKLGAKENCIVFVPSIENSRNLALRIAKFIGMMRVPFADPSLADARKHQAAQLPNAMRRCIACGVAWHNGNLSSQEREVVQEAFKQKSIRLIVATTTLAAGINLPTRLVILRKLCFWQGESIEAGRFAQMCGRAGRPGFDDCGDALVILKSNRELT